MMDTLILDVMLEIHNFLNFPSQVNLRLTSTHFATHYHVTNLYDNKPLGFQGDDSALARYPHVTKLSLSHSSGYNISRLTRLQKLTLHWYNCVDDEQLSELTNLVMLSISSTDLVSDVNHLVNLRVLKASTDIYARCASNISNTSLSNLTNLTTLWTDNNPKITDINHMTNLRKLSARGNSGIGDSGIKNLPELRELYVSDNVKVRDVNHLTKLEVLHMRGKTGITAEGRKHLPKTVKVVTQ